MIKYNEELPSITTIYGIDDIGTYYIINNKKVYYTKYNYLDHLIKKGELIETFMSQ